MTRHGKNSTANPVYTYHERRKSSEKSGYGTQKERLGKDSIKNFDCCSLTLQPCKEPVVTPDGYLYDKEAILECLIHQKREIARQMKEYDRQCQKLEMEQKSTTFADERARRRQFLETEHRITTKPVNPFTARVEGEAGAAAADSSSSGAKKTELPSFWVPSLTPDAKPTLVKKPAKNPVCPMSGKPLKLKDLIPVQFTPIDEADGRSLIAKEVRYKCSVTNDELSNFVPCAVLRKSGRVVTMECVEKLIRKDMLDPMSGEKLEEKDIIQLQRGGTGFAGSGVDLTASAARPVAQY